MSGAYAWGSLGDAKGRKLGFFATALFTFTFGVLSAVAPSYGVSFLESEAAADPHTSILPELAIWRISFADQDLVLAGKTVGCYAASRLAYDEYSTI